MKKGLKESKKYATGSVHEIGGGKFEILDRWFDEDTDTIMLKYKFLEDGRIEENKEVNVNASEWKWRKSRGLTGKADEHALNENLISITHMEEYFEGIFVRLEQLINENKGGVKAIEASIAEHHKVMTQSVSQVLKIVEIQQKQIDTLLKDNQIINKLLEKI